MADPNTSLPVRTEAPGDLQVKLGDGTTPSQYLAIDAAGLLGSKLYDGAGTAITSGAQAGGKQALDIEILVGGAVIDPRAIRALTSADVVTANQGTAAATASAWPIKLTDGTNVTAVKAASTAAIATDPSAVVALSPNSPLPAGSNALGSVNADIRVGGTAVSGSNPVPVQLAPGVSGTEVNSYNTVSALAANASSNHDYSITAAKTFKGDKFWASASGMLKIEVQTSVDGTTFVSKFVGFSSTANPNIAIDLGEVSLSCVNAGGGKIRIIRTNRDKSAMDVYSTICGSEV